MVLKVLSGHWLTLYAPLSAALENTVTQLPV